VADADRSDVLRVLGQVSKRTVASPYELELAGAGPSS
jgi:hypothetical protein